MRLRLLVLGGFDVGEFSELVDDADGFDAYGGDALEEVDDAFLVVGESVGVEEGRPIIGMTLRYDRLDNFWFILMHELAHVGRHEARDENQFFDDMSLRGANNVADDCIEIQADEWAEEALIPGDVWKASAVQFSPRPLDVIQLASEVGVHPAVVAGRVRYERGDYRLLSQLVGNGEVRGLF